MTDYSHVASLFVRIAINLLLLGTPICVATTLILKLTRAGSPRARYLLTVTAFLVAAFLPLSATLLPTSEDFLQPSLVEGPGVKTAEIPGLAPTGNGYSGSFHLAIPATDVEPAAVAKSLDSIASFLATGSLSVVLLGLWLAGSCLLLGRELAGHLRLARARREWKPATTSLRDSLSWPNDLPLYVDEEDGPCAVGLLKPVVVIPASLLNDLSPYAASQVARHELNHLKWRDPAINALMRAVRGALWPSLPLWYLERAARVEREAAADRAAVASYSPEIRTDTAVTEYASALVSIAERSAREARRYATGVAQLGNISGLDDRVRRLMASSSRPTSIRLLLACITLLAGAAGIFVLPVARLETRNEFVVSSQRGERHESTSVQGPPSLEGKEKEESKSAIVSILSNAPKSNEQAGPKAASRAQIQLTALVIGDKSTIPGTAGATTYNTETGQMLVNTDTLDFQRQMAALGYDNLSARQIAAMKAYAVTPGYVREMTAMGYGGLSADLLINFRWLGVSASYINEMKALGYDNLSARTLANFREYGVSSAYIQEMRSRVSGSITAEQLVSLRLFGATVDFVDKLKSLGYERLTAGQLISIRLQGVTIAYIEEMKTRRVKEISINELISMRIQGIN